MIGNSEMKVREYFNTFDCFSISQVVRYLIEVTPIYAFFLWKIYNSFIEKMKSFKNESEARQQRFLLEMIMNNLPSLLWSVDKDLILTFIRGKSLEIFFDKIPPEQIEGLHFKDALSMSNYSEFNDLCIERHNSVLKGETCSFIINVVDAVFQINMSPWVNEKGEIIGVIGIANDVTYLVRAENALKTSEEHYRSLVENVQDLIVKIDRDYNVLFTNSRHLPFLNMNPQEYIGKNIIELFNMDDKLKTEVQMNLKRVFENNESVYWEWTFRDSSKERDQKQKNNLITDTLHFYARVSPILKDDVAIAATFFCSDITEKRKVQESLLAVEKAEIANKSKSDFLRILSHEIRNPLNSVLGALQLLSTTPHLSPLQIEYIEDASESAKLLLAIIQDVLDMSKIEEGKLNLVNTTISVLEIIETTADMYSANALEKNLELVTYVDSNIPAAVIGDKTRLGQVLSNLCTNSIKYTKSGYVYISAVLLSENDTHASIRFSCEDTGVGIPESQLPFLFKPFSQLRSTPNENKGWGLGLAICDRLVKLMHGKISVKSPANRFGGAEFSFTLEMPKSENYLLTNHHLNNSLSKDSQSVGITSKDSSQYLNLRSNISTIRENSYCSRFENCIVMVSSELLCQVISKYLETLRVKRTHIVSSKLELTELVNYYRNLTRYKMDETGEDNQIRTAVIIESKYESLLPEGFETELQADNNLMKLIVIFDTAAPNTYSENTEVKAIIRKPIRFTRLLSALSEQKNIMSSLVWDRNLELQLQPISNGDRAKENTTSKENSCVNILVVEDNSLNRKIVVRLLEKCGFQSVDTACNGEEALRKVINKIGTYDCILMDLQMPVMDGKVATKHIRNLPDKVKSQTPIIALTANAWINEREECLSIGMNDVVTKPITLDTLISTIKKVTHLEE
jgi:PAS domain S-box-containing protein